MCISKTAIAKGAGGGVQIPYVIILGGKVLIHQTFLTFPPPTPTPPPLPPPGRNKRPAPFKIPLYPYHHFCNAAWWNIKRKTRVKRSKKQKLELYKPLQLTSFTSSLQYPLIPHRTDEGPLICFPLAQENEQIEWYL